MASDEGPLDAADRIAMYDRCAKAIRSVGESFQVLSSQLGAFETTAVNTELLVQRWIDILEKRQKIAVDRSR
ncbi:Uncharacterized protein PBTT_07007 [Plasmodiophora brassicae]